MRGLSAIPGTAGQVGWKDSADQSTGIRSQADQHAKMKENICTQLLIDGYVQSYVDLFYLTHRNDSTPQHRGDEFPQAAMAKTGAFSVVELPEMEFLRDQLVAAEHCKRRGEIPDVMAAYDSLATYCAEKQDNKTMIFFYEKCLEISHNPEAQAHSQFKIGTCYNALNEPANGLSFLETNLAVARQIGDAEGEGNACAALATAHEKLGNQQLSIEFLNQYVAIATRAENIVNQADACARLGQIYTASQNFQRAREMHDKNYELVQAVAARSGDRLQQNISRVSVGAARANDKLAMLLTLVKDDFHGLLAWKNTRAVSTTE
ncbi:hypothetical protein JG688_00004372 [Phytophthora aleatoria]|uniref:MalT-like TPR region domain-containing protein n=1 Tax=Phytophthora aleatoria TaxID=2496075 RepID=A0A8J5JE28_9STRA|nr:hypothetical protein JG688_00004372 [Phytophthora aleatoria]